MSSGESDEREEAPAIPFNRPSIEGRELEYIREAVQEGHTSASGPFSRRVSDLLVDAHGAEEVLLTTSCTDALEMTAMLLQISPGDKVIVPSFTFVSTALAYAREGAQLLFCDIDADTLAVDPAHVEELLDDDVRAVVTVHYAGIAGDVAGLLQVLAGHPRVDLIEDNAHGLYGVLEGRLLGTFGRFSTLSFHETKNFICGEGGALVLNDASDVDRAHVLYDKGTNRRAFMLGTVDKYSWQDTGSSFGMSEVLAAYLMGQLEQREAVLASRKRVFEGYRQRLSRHVGELGYRLPCVPDGREPAYHMFYVLLPSRKVRDAVLNEMRQNGILATFHYVPLHSSAGGRKYSARETQCPVTEDVSGRLLRLPFFNSLQQEDIERVCDVFLSAVAKFVR